MTSARTKHPLTVAQIAELINAEVVGESSIIIDGVEFIERATATDLAFVGNQKNLSRAQTTEALVIVAPRDVGDKLADYSTKTFLLVAEPEAAFLEVAQQLFPVRQRQHVGISEHAVVAASATIGANTSVHPFAVIGEDVVLGEGCTVASGAVVSDGCVLGDNVRIDPNAVLYPDVRIGNDTAIQAGAVLGAEGFGYRTVNGRHERLPHVGIVNIGNDVHIGSCTTIDKAKMGETVIGSGTRIDNQVMIAHNCQIGEHNLLCSQTGIAGSSSTGKYVVCAGQVGIADHVHLGDMAIVGAKAGVHRDMPGGESYLGAPARKAGDVAREMTALKRLPEMRKTMKQMEKQIAELQEQLKQVLAMQHDSAAQNSREAA